METWAIVMLVLGASVISALSAWLTTRMQVSRSDRRFEKELGRTKEENQQKRRWEVRSEPLLKLRSELACMAAKLEKLAKQGKTFTVPEKTSEQEQEALRQAVSDWKSYVEGDCLEEVLYSQSDTEIVNSVRDIRNECLNTYDMVVTYKGELSSQEFGQAARAAEERIRPTVAEVQELINKRLEQL